MSVIKFLAIVAVLISVLAMNGLCKQTPPTDAAPTLVISASRVHQLDGHKLEFALWSDGIGICRSKLYDTASDLIVFKTDKSVAQSVQAALGNCTDFDTCKMRLVIPPSSNHARMLINRKGERIWLAWNEVVRPGGSPGQTEEGQTFINMWALTRSLIVKVVPQGDTELLTDRLDESGAFREYDPSKPHLCPSL
jgi:hypothetical protein